MSFPPATEMFQFAGFASCTYGFSAGYPLRGGLPHSEIPGSTIARISPGLFAACHVLHRLSVPRHPPDALHSRLSATPNGKNHIRCNNVAPRRQAKPKISPKAPAKPRFTKSCLLTRCDKTLLLRRHFVRDCTHGPRGRPRSPASVTQLASSQLSINKRHRRSNDPPVTKSVPLPRPVGLDRGRNAWWR